MTVHGFKVEWGVMNPLCVTDTGLRTRVNGLIGSLREINCKDCLWVLSQQRRLWHEEEEDPIHEPPTCISRIWKGEVTTMCEKKEAALLADPRYATCLKCHNIWKSMTHTRWKDAVRKEKGEEIDRKWYGNT